MKKIVDSKTHVQLERERLNIKRELLRNSFACSRLKTEQRKLQKKLDTLDKDLASLSKPTNYDQLVAVMIIRGTVFSAENAGYYDVKKPSEGPGERRYRSRWNLNQDLSGDPKKRDVPEHNNLELKGVYQPTIVKRKSCDWEYERPTLTSIRAGQCACDKLADGRYDAICKAMEMGIAYDPEIKKLINGTLNEKQFAKMPCEISSILFDYIKPSEGLAECTGGLAVVIPEGWFFIPVVDYDIAFIITSVSKGLVKYALSMNYVRQQLNVETEVDHAFDRTFQM